MSLYDVMNVSVHVMGVSGCEVGVSVHVIGVFWV